MEHKKFWLVWKPNGALPTFKHPSYDDAKKEAERLARKNSADRFYILEALEVVSVELPVTVQPLVPLSEEEISEITQSRGFSSDEIPF